MITLLGAIETSSLLDFIEPVSVMVSLFTALIALTSVVKRLSNIRIKFYVEYKDREETDDP